MGKKQNFSFMPTLTAMNSTKDALPSASSTSNSDIKEVTKRRDLKATVKSVNCHQLQTSNSDSSVSDVIYRHHKLSNDKYQLPNVEIRVPDLLLKSQKQP